MNLSVKYPLCLRVTARKLRLLFRRKGKSAKSSLVESTSSTESSATSVTSPLAVEALPKEKPKSSQEHQKLGPSFLESNLHKEILLNCLAYADHLKLTFEIDKARFLYALSGVESSHGANNVPRMEPAYSPGGFYFDRSQALKDAFAVYGTDASCSWGPWQILYIVANEYGYNDEPSQLQFPDVSAPFVAHHLNKFSRNGANSLERILDCYNTGNHFDKNKPIKYIEKFWAFYLNSEKVIEDFRRGSNGNASGNKDH